MPRFAIADMPTLDPGLRAAWNGLRGRDPVYASPYFSPEFHEAVASVTRNARLLIAEDGGAPVALLPFQRRVGGLSGPIGGHLNDIHGLIARPGFDLPAGQVLEQARVPMLSLRHAPVGTAALGARFGQPHGFHVIDLAGGYAAYEARREPFAKSAFKTIRSRTEKARKQFGSVTHVFADASPASLEKLIGWKRGQYAATGQPSLFGIGWVRELVERLHTSRDLALKGQLSCLYFGDELVAAHFGLRSPDVLHYWFPGYDPAYGELSPGNILLRMMAEAGSADGCQALHLGAGDYRYKQEFADRNFAVTGGVAFAGSAVGWTAAAAGVALARMERALPQRIAGLPGKALKRLDRQLAFKAA